MAAPLAQSPRPEPARSHALHRSQRRGLSQRPEPDHTTAPTPGRDVDRRPRPRRGTGSSRFIPGRVAYRGVSDAEGQAMGPAHHNATTTRPDCRPNGKSWSPMRASRICWPALRFRVRKARRPSGAIGRVTDEPLARYSQLTPRFASECTPNARADSTSRNSAGRCTTHALRDPA
jgi:hypothetical protein